MKGIFSILAGILFIAGFAPYIRAILKGETKPAKATWLIWATLDIITLVGMHVAGTINGQIIGASLGASIVFILSLKFGESGWTKIDAFCLAGAILSIVLWRWFDDPVLGIVTSLSAMSIGSIPTIVSAWEDPQRENKLGWILFWTSCVCALIAIPNITLADVSQPFAFFVVDSVILYIVIVHRHQPSA